MKTEKVKKEGIKGKKLKGKKKILKFKPRTDREKWSTACRDGRFFRSNLSVRMTANNF